jgi:hypothetical protein
VPKTVEQIKNLELYIRSAFTNANTGRLEGYSAGLRGDLESNISFRIPAALAPVALMAGDVAFIENATVHGDSNSNWKTLRGGHLSLEPAMTSAPAATSAVKEDIPFTVEEEI